MMTSTSTTTTCNGIWDITTASTLADSNVNSAAREAGAPAEQAAIRKISKYSVLSQSNLFQPIAVENTGFFNISVVDFLIALGRRISSSSGEERESSFFSNAFLLGLYHATLQRHSFAQLFCSWWSGLLVIQDVFSIGFIPSWFKVPSV